MAVPEKIERLNRYTANQADLSLFTFPEVVTFETLKFFDEKSIINIKMSIDYPESDLADPEQFALETCQLEARIEKALQENQSAAMIAVQACDFFIGDSYTGFVGGGHHEFEETKYALQIITDLSVRLQAVLKRYNY